jgi:hypothetical protein
VLSDCGVQVCDEGHRLKAKGGNKTIDSLLALNCPKRVVLTGVCCAVHAFKCQLHVMTALQTVPSLSVRYDKVIMHVMGLRLPT